GLEQDEVTHHHGLAMHRCEGKPAAERQRRLDCDAIQRDMKIRARQAVAVNLAADGRGFAERGIDLLPINVGGARRQRQCERYAEGEQNWCFLHDHLSCCAPYFRNESTRLMRTRARWRRRSEAVEVDVSGNMVRLRSSKRNLLEPSECCAGSWT